MLLFIIFGWPKRSKEYGPVQPGQCEHCQNNVWWHLVKTRRWFTLYFIPLLPLEFANRYAVCGVCTMADEIEKSEWKALKSVRSDAQAYLEGEVSSDEYMAQLEDALRGLEAYPGIEPADADATQTEREKINASEVESRD